MRRFKAVFAGGLFLTGLLTISEADEARRAEQGLKQIIDRFHESTARLNVPEVKATLNNVDIIIEDSPVLNAWILRALPRPSHRSKVTITTGYFLQLTYFTELNILAAKSQNLAKAHQVYLRYAYELTGQNQNNLIRKLPLVTLKSPEEYAKIDPRCALLATAYPFPDSEKETRSRQTAAAVNFTILHELGHQWLGHRGLSEANFKRATTDKERWSSAFSEMRRSRNQEYDADRWATRQLMIAGNHPLEILNNTTINSLVNSSGLDAFFETSSTHPMALNRVKTIIAEIRRCDRELRGGKTVTGAVETVLNDLELLAQKAQTLLPPTPEAAYK